MGSSDNIIRDFLRSPRDTEKFNEFYRLIFRHTLGYLNYLRRRGYTMPSETGSRDRQLTDLTVDILGALLRCDGSRPFHVVFEHFDRCGFKELDETSSVDLEESLHALLNGHGRQEISKLRGQEDPQVSHLKRRFKDILKGDEYVTFRRNEDGAEYVHLAGSDADLRSDKPAATGASLELLVETAYRSSNSRAEWCRKIFDMLNSDIEYQNFVAKHELLSAIVAVNCRELDPCDGIARKTHQPKEGMLQRLMKQASEHAVERTECEVLAKFIDKKRVSEYESAALITALNAYLSDLCEHGDTDPIPRYFKENMPEEAYGRYLNDYKYVFETTVNKAVEFFKEFMRKNGTYLGLGDY